MRVTLILSMLLGLTASANAETQHHRHDRVIVRSVNPSFASPGYDRRNGPTRFDDVPSYDDPSKLGGQPPCGC